MKPDGTIILAIPDKRYCFDFFRPPTTTADVIEAHDAKRTRHGGRTAFEHLAYAVMNDGQGAWGQAPVGTLRFADDFAEAMAKLEARTGTAAYSDFHAWKLTPATFELILLETCALGLCDWRAETSGVTAGCEFHVRLRRGGRGAVAAMSAGTFDSQRMTLLRRSLKETRQQLDWALDAPAPPAPMTAAPEVATKMVALPLGYAPPPPAVPPRVAVILHLFHTDLGIEFREPLENIPVPFDLFISTTDTKRARAIRASFKGWTQGTPEIRVFPNRGRDIGAKLSGFRDVYGAYDFVLFLHSKKSPHASTLDGWRRHLTNSLAGSPGIVSGIFEIFARRPAIGMISAHHFGPIASGIKWGPNLEAAESLANRMGIAIDPGVPLDMPSGSMFWTRTGALRPLLELDLSFDDFPIETGQVDGTLAHAIERLFFYVCERAGYAWIKIAAEYPGPALTLASPADLDAALAGAISPLIPPRKSGDLVIFPHGTLRPDGRASHG